jgi:protein TonB
MQGYQAAGSGDWRRPSIHQRLGVLALIVAAELVLLVLIIAFGGSRIRERAKGAAATAVIFIRNSPEPAAVPRQAAPIAQAQKAVARPTKTSPVLKVTPPLPVVREALPYVPLSKADLAAGDIARLGTAASPAGAKAGEGKVAQGAGEGPGGVQLYNAEWVVEPSDAQLRPYLPRQVERGSWALIACQTIAHNRVENCAQLGEAPRGSGLSKAMRLAAWQFQVRPPRINGKPMVGAWVRIRIDFGRDGEPR